MAALPWQAHNCSALELTALRRHTHASPTAAEASTPVGARRRQGGGPAALSLMLAGTRPARCCPGAAGWGSRRGETCPRPYSCPPSWPTHRPGAEALRDRTGGIQCRRAARQLSATANWQSPPVVEQRGTCGGGVRASVGMRVTKSSNCIPTACCALADIAAEFPDLLCSSPDSPPIMGKKTIAALPALCGVPPQGAICHLCALQCRGLGVSRSNYSVPSSHCACCDTSGCTPGTPPHLRVAGPLPPAAHQPTPHASRPRAATPPPPCHSQPLRRCCCR